MFTSLERYIPLFEAYLLSTNKSDFIKSRSDPNERSLLDVLTQPLTDINIFRQKMKKNNINYQLQNELADYKLYSYIQSAQDLKNQSLFNDLKQKYASRNFDFSRPEVLNAQEPKKGQEKSSDSEINLPQTLEQYLESKKKTNSQFIRSLNDYGFSKLTEQTLHHLSLSDKQYVLEKFSTIFHLSSSFLSKFLIDYEKEKRKTNEAYRIPNKILSCLTKKQLLSLGEHHHQAFNNQDYIQLWFNQLYAETIRKHVQNSSLFTKVEQSHKRDAFNKIVHDLQKHSHYPIIKRYTNKLKSQILVLDAIVNDPSLERLVDYLSSSQVGFQLNNIQPLFYDELRQRQRELVQDPRMRYRLEVDKTSPNAFVEEYIELLFKNHKEQEPIIKALNKFLDQKYLRKTSVKVRLYKGETIENINDYFNQQELQSMKDRREIRLLPSNPKKYRVQDDVKLDISIKNVKKIQIKVYILNLEKHLLGDSCNYTIDDEVELSFLIPTAQDFYQNSSTNPFETITTQIDLSKIIPKAMGVYIVDFQGQTVSSRAVIRKGTIICVDTLTEAGQQFSFFDQNGRPLEAKDGLKVWIRGQIAELIDNKAFVTYADQTEYGTIVASVGDYAESYQKKFEEEKYKFDAGYIYNSESFLVGRKAKIILHGRLSMNEKSMNLQLLKKTKVNVTVTNHQDIKTSFPFQIQKWTNLQDQVIQFPIQAYTKQINVVVQSTILLQNKKQISLNNSKDIKIDTSNSFYLEQDQKQCFKLSYLGLNGEPIPNADIIISFGINGIEEAEKKTIKTNSEGQILLGKLAIVNRLTAQVNNSDNKIKMNWQIDQSENNFNYNNTIHFKLGQSLSLPINKKWKKGEILFLRTFDKFYSEDLTQQLHIQNGRVTFPVINEEGFYIVKLLPIDKTIEIITLKNNKWQDDNIENQKVYDQAEGTVYEISKNIYQNVAIQDVEFNQSQSHVNACLTLDLDGLPEEYWKYIRVHVLANNYLQTEIADLFKTENFNVQGQLAEHYIQSKKSAYYSNKTFSQEGAYVWNRQSKNEQLIGNNLEKPSLFLKRILVRETSQNNQNLYNEGKYIEECAMMDVDANVRQRLCAQRIARKQTYQNNKVLNNRNNFLLISGDISKNLKGKTIKFQIPLGYHSIQVYLLTPKTALKGVYSFGWNQPHHKKDLRHTGLEKTQENVGWTMSRQINQLKYGDKRTVNRDSQWRTVGLTDIFEFARNKKVKLYDWSNHLLNWSTYTEEKKREIYDKQCCHELNTFIKFKDATFFDSVVAKFIRNKIQKTVVDLCLLNDPSCIEFTALSKLSKLNAFEKTLLVYTLTQNNQNDAANSIVESMQLLQKSIKRNYQQYKNNFDTIINAKEPEEKPKPRMQVLASETRYCDTRQDERERGISMLRSRKAQSCQRMQRREKKMEEKKAFVPIESTKQYTERTYYNVKDYRVEAPSLVSSSRFWAQVARNLLIKNSEIISQTFMDLKTPIDFILASSFISNDSSSNYEISNSNEGYEIHPKSSMLLYVKEVKKVDYLKKFGVLINQRFLDPKNRRAYEEDGTEYEREVEQFIVRKPYICQTVINNTSGTPLQLQVLLDIPRGAIPLKSYQYTQIINIRINPYSSESQERYFYFPEEGEYDVYPSNASRGSSIIAKSNPIPTIIVKKVWTINKLQSFEDILRSGDKEQVIAFLQKRNIFDSNVFKPNDILWMLKDKEFYHKVIDILRKRSFFNQSIWNFAFLHNDLPAIKEHINQGSNQGITLAPISFEYFPYYSSRTHQFANESKSTIRNVQFKQTYIRFLIGSAVGLKSESFEVSYSYYLILQDRLREANEIIKGLTQEQYHAHEIQFDYMRCFLDLSLNAPNFTIARETIKKYDSYPVESWRKLFTDVKNTIEAQDNEFAAEIDNQNIEAFQTQVIQEQGLFKVIQPADTKIIVQIFEINLQLYFSQYPFIEIKTFTSVKPSIVRCLEGSKETKESIIKRSEFENLKDATVQITEIKTGLPPKKVSTFWWTNPDIKVKLNQASGTLQVYLNKRRLPGSYVKVFSDKGFNKQFYRDGYTDMTGTFRYAMSDLDGIKEFSILVMTEKGGVIQKVQPPSKLASF